jgi:hypothetical protein
MKLPPPISEVPSWQVAVVVTVLPPGTGAAELKAVSPTVGTPTSVPQIAIAVVGKAPSALLFPFSVHAFEFDVPLVGRSPAAPPGKLSRVFVLFPGTNPV